MTSLSEAGFKTVGELPQGLPDIHWPSLRLRDVDGVLPLAFACFLLGYIESVSAARALARKNGYEIDRLDIPNSEKERMQNNIPVAYAVSYLVGTGFAVWFLSSLAPRLLGVDLREESRKLEAQSSAGANTDTGTRSAYREWDLRAYRIPDTLAGRTVLDVEHSFTPNRVFVERIRRDHTILDAVPDTVLRAATWRSWGRGATCSFPGGRPSGRKSRTGRSWNSPWPPWTWSSPIIRHQ